MDLGFDSSLACLSSAGNYSIWRPAKANDIVTGSHFSSNNLIPLHIRLTAPWKNGRNVRF
jgi:hypothetical protein